jgi:hypothetical protein
MSQAGSRRQGVSAPVLTSIWFVKIAPNRSWLIIINDLGLSGELRTFSIHRCTMRSLSAFLACASILAASAASADSRVFIIANQADAYGVDQCLARGDKCGAHAARSYCQSRDFAQATSYRRVDPDEITGAVPKGANEHCTGRGCGEYVAITCQR